MNSREKILEAVKKSQPDPIESPAILSELRAHADAQGAEFISVLESIGGAAFIIPAIGAIPTILREQYPVAKRIVSKLPGQGGNFPGGELLIGESADPHSLADVDLAIIPAHFGVAENAACWITEDLMAERALPFICEHLAVVIDKKDIIPTMHEAYDLIGNADYGFGTFIAGPSKTADIEQSLVLGAHGPKSMIVFIIDPQISDAGFY